MVQIAENILLYINVVTLRIFCVNLTKYVMMYRCVMRKVYNILDYLALVLLEHFTVQVFYYYTYRYMNLKDKIFLILLKLILGNLNFFNIKLDIVKCRWQQVCLVKDHINLLKMQVILLLYRKSGRYKRQLYFYTVVIL